LTGIAVGSSSLMYDSFYPALIGFNSIPKVAVVPILVIWFGVGTIPAIITAFLIAFFPILVNVAVGIATVEPQLQSVLRALGAGREPMASDQESRAAAVDALFLCFLEGGDYLRVRRHDRCGDGRSQQGDRQPDAGGVVAIRSAACVRRSPGHQRHGYRHVSRVRSGRAADDRLGHARRGCSAYRAGMSGGCPAL